MVVTCHFVDSDFQLHKYILNFVDVPPPYTGVHIYDCLFKCLKEWNIEKKVASLTVDNVRTNDVVAKKFMENLNIQNKLAIDGQLFHVRCCAHILNLLVQDDLLEIKDIIHNVRESVKHVSASPGRLHQFSELSKQLLMPKKHLILDVSTRWNATYAMLSTTLEFKNVFVNYADREPTYNTLPSDDDWKKVEDVCSFLALFNAATELISGSEYPTSNLFLSELFGIKEAPDVVALNDDGCMKGMAEEMKKKIDNGIKTGSAKFAQHIRTVDCAESVKSALTTYLEEGVYISEPGVHFDALGWWKANKLKYKILSKMVADVLAIPVTTVASESAFSAAGGRVIDSNRSCLGTKTVDMLICGADWYRHYYGLEKKKAKENDDVVCVELT
ncbi:zinc finger BED domain-containing protein RICESLEEPER 2-like [Helianthus annuus]|uniref:zinc finger BED domain-containing protein RICESLEEPER 2-like n=1 Tax=Helianthus annuus TaxID=4232 RepID=UPI000B8F6186|nr:zinc finger BED domain-containing protein RICESLEEPER 2-like [Helianthus annuus]